MSEPNLDPALLSTPTKPTLAPSLNDDLQVPSAPQRQTRPSDKVYVSLPSLSLAEKANCKGSSEVALTSDVEFDPEDLDEIIGEYRDKGTSFYFVRFQDGMAHKFQAEPFKASYNVLVELYERKKKDGLLAPFDPSASYVHPRSRHSMVFRINNVRQSLKVKSGFGPLSKQRRSPSYVESSSSVEDQENDDSEYSDGGLQPLRRSSRVIPLVTKPVKKLPFSPRKTRSRKVYVSDHSSDEETWSTPGSEADEQAPLRRSTRTRATTKAKNADSDNFSDIDEASEDDDSSDREPSRELPKRKPPGKKFIRRAAYGRVRAAVDLEYDSQSDEETAPFRVHRSTCERCHRKPAHKLLEAERKKPKGRKKSQVDEFEDEGDEDEKITALGGWLRCLKCPVVAHWKCLAAHQRDEILKAARDRDQANVPPPTTGNDAQDGEQPKADQRKNDVLIRVTLDAYQTTEFICSACMKGGICMGCKEVALEPDANLRSEETTKMESLVKNQETRMKSVPLEQNRDSNMTDARQTSAPEIPATYNPSRELLYRCFSCKRLAHYRCLPCPPSVSPPADPITLAGCYQSDSDWYCADCSSYSYGLDKILAWRPYPPNAIEPPRPDHELPNYKSMLPREYLVKWVDKSYRRTQWVPHMWLVFMHSAKLRNFLAGGAKVKLLAEPATGMETGHVEGEAALDFEIEEDESVDSTSKAETKPPALPSDPIPDAELRVPPAWKTIDRVLDILLWCPTNRSPRISSQKKNSKKKKRRIITGSEDDELTELDEDDEGEELKKERAAIFDDGEQPAADLTETVDEFEHRTGESLGMEHIDQVVWAFIKWDDLGYDESTWDSPPLPGEFGYTAFQVAFERFLYSRQVTVPLLNKKEISEFDNRPKDGFGKNHSLADDEQPDLGQNAQLKLMRFQIDGFNWLSNNWWNLQHCILADEMGLGKTVQIATFIGNLVKNWNAYPVLIVVPNSTITNWVRELQRWAPHLRVVPFYGEAKARDIVKNFELQHDTKIAGTTGAKFHVLVTTYESVNNPKDFNLVFKKQPRWEVLVVDEAQRLKNDSSLLFKKLNHLNTIHRVIMTGTPLNNNIRELFNLMNFLEPEEWQDLEKLEKEHEELTEELIKQLHQRLRPYFLRRTKGEVLQLPPKNEVIVPVSMSPLQKEVYRSILSQNVEILKSLTQQQSSSKLGKTKIKANISNLLMQLRKCLQHPYLYAEHIEPTGLSEQETHEKLIDASAKLRLLKILLPKLKARGHRVLLFSQFVIALNVIEDFLDGEQIKHLRLDGGTKFVDRQKGMDEFNRPGSDVFIYLLSTRAGGVGINLWSADTVIIFDPDFNPHQDLQAIARAHRYGQTKTCLVFKLMVKDSAEERIIQTGKKKMVLDHLIVQKMDDEDSAGATMQSILTYGAKALFDENHEDKEITYTDNDIDKLIEKTEKEGEQESVQEQGFSFAFAKIWAAGKDSLEDVVTDAPDDQGDSWAQALQRIATVQEQRQVQEITGRGVRRRAAATAPQRQQHLDFDDSPPKAASRSKLKKAQSKSTASDDSIYSVSMAESDGESEDSAIGEEGVLDLMDLAPDDRKRYRPNLANFAGPSSMKPAAPTYPNVAPLTSIHNLNHNDSDDDMSYCGLCARTHGGACFMTEKSENLAEFRQMLLAHDGHESLEDRQAAIKAIEGTLAKRGRIELIAGQPLHIVQAPKAAKPIDRKANASHSKYSKMKAVMKPDRGTNYAPVANPMKDLNSASSLNPFAVQAPLAGSKRTSPFLEGSSQNKKSKQTFSMPCVICGQLPHHLVKDCPVVGEGPGSVAREIKRLERDPSMSRETDILRKILRKQTKERSRNEQSLYH